jgi:hypothetical protein
MKPVKRYTTFEELKSSEEKSVGAKTRLKKHREFEKFIKSITPAKNKNEAGSSIQINPHGR